MPGRERLEGGGEGLEVLPVVVRVVRAAEDVVELVEELVVRERHRVGRRESWQQPALVALVVEDDLLVGVAAGGELATLAGRR